MNKYLALAAVSLSLSCSLASDAAETWADAKMPVQSGLQLWLDASHASGSNPPAANRKLNKWLDAAGNKARDP